MNTRRKVHRRRKLYNPFTLNYVLDLLSDKDDLDELRERMKKFVNNDELWKDLHIAVSAQRRIRKVEL